MVFVRSLAGRFSRLGIARTSSALLSAYRKRSFSSRFSRLGIAQASLALHSAYRKRSNSCTFSRLGIARTSSALHSAYRKRSLAGTRQDIPQSSSQGILPGHPSKVTASRRHLQVLRMFRRPESILFRSGHPRSPPQEVRAAPASPAGSARNPCIRPPPGTFPLQPPTTASAATSRRSSGSGSRATGRSRRCGASRRPRRPPQAAAASTRAGGSWSRCCALCGIRSPAA